MKRSMEDQVDFKAKMNEGFKAVRRAGYFARQNHTCCGSCGWSEVPEGKAERVVFYHRQEGERIAAGKCAAYLQWAGDAAVIVKAFTDAGLEVVHDGKDTSAIVIKLPEPVVPKTADELVGEQYEAFFERLAS